MPGKQRPADVVAAVHAYEALPQDRRATFRAVVGLTVGRSDAAPVDDIPQARERFPEFLYARLQASIAAISGIRLPALSSISNTSARAEVHYVWKWLGGEVAATREARYGLVTLCADCVANSDVPSRLFDPSKPGSAGNQTVSLLRLVPAIVDSAFPGYHRNGLLLSVATSIGMGKLGPRKKTSEET